MMLTYCTNGHVNPESKLPDLFNILNCSIMSCTVQLLQFLTVTFEATPSLLVFMTRVGETRFLFEVPKQEGLRRATTKLVVLILLAMADLVSIPMNVEAPLIMKDMKRDALLQALQTSIYFEKTVAATNAANPRNCTMALPSWFVTEHGDKLIRQSVLLRCGSSTEPWRVTLTISFKFPRCSSPAVKFSGGWKTFASANDLTIGDSLIFCLRAMSEFDVFIFRETRSPIKPTAVQAPRKRSHDLKLSKGKVRKTLGCRNLVTEGSAGRLISEILEKGKAQARIRVNKKIEDWQGRNIFEKTLTVGAVSKAFQLTLPTLFMRQHGDMIREHVVLKSVADGKLWTPKVFVNFPDKRPQFIFDGGAWKEFVISNGLVTGDQVTFTLVAMSKFEVFILRRGRNPKEVHPSVQGPAMQFRGSAFSQTSQLPVESFKLQHRALTGKMERKSSSKVFAEKGCSEDSDAYSASDSTQSPSDMDSHTFERWFQGLSKKVCR